MIEIAYLKENDKIKSMQNEVQEVLKKILKVLDTEYGVDRNYNNDGGYVIVVEKLEDFDEMKKNTHIDCDEIVAEYVDKIVCTNGEVYTNSLIICNNDYAISIIIPLELTPQNLRDYMID